MSPEIIRDLAKQAGAKIFGEKIVVADQGSSGLGTEFCKKFAELILNYSNGGQDDHNGTTL